jgi:hypothetical protein
MAASAAVADLQDRRCLLADLSLEAIRELLRRPVAQDGEVDLTGLQQPLERLGGGVRSNRFAFDAPQDVALHHPQRPRNAVLLEHEEVEAEAHRPDPFRCEWCVAEPSPFRRNIRVVKGRTCWALNGILFSAQDNAYHRAMKLEIRPLDGVGPLQFGMSIRNARASLAEPLKALGKGWPIVISFLKDYRRDGVPTDDIRELDLHLYYRVRGERIVLVAVEMFPPAAPELHGIPLFGAPYPHVRDQVLKHDPAALIESDGLRSLALGVALNDPSCGDEPEAPAASAFAFERGYWDQPLAPLVPR